MIFVPQTQEVTGDWRKFRNQGHQDVYTAPNIIQAIRSKSMRWAGHVARARDKRNAYTLLARKPEEKELFG
jgi:hypothetical protein